MAAGSHERAGGESTVSALHLVRHGQAAFGTADYDRLTPLGAEQCAALARHWHALGRAAPPIYSGSMRRHRDSAQAFADALRGLGAAVGPVETVPGLEEYDHEALLDRHAAVSPSAGATVASCTPRCRGHCRRGPARASRAIPPSARSATAARPRSVR